MLNYIIKRLIQSIPLLLGITFLCFLIIQLAPGDYFDQLRMNPQISEDTLNRMRAEFNLDKSWPVQYLSWLKGVLTGNLGYSFSYRTPVSFLIKARLWNTFILGLYAMTISWLIGIPIGIICSVKQYSWTDKLLSILAYIGMSLPGFFIAFLFLYAASSNGILPTGGMVSATYESLSPFKKVTDVLSHLILPGTALGITSIASLSRIMRSNMLDNLRMQFIITARAKGLNEKKIIWKHALRNSINPMITLFGLELPALLSGAALIEIVCAWPGLGQLMLEAVLRQDVFLIMGDILMGSILLICGNLLADILLALSDPRIRYS